MDYTASSGDSGVASQQDFANQRPGNLLPVSNPANREAPAFCRSQLEARCVSRAVRSRLLAYAGANKLYHTRFLAKGATVAQRLACSTPTNANRVQFLTRSLLGFRLWESCRTMPLVCGFFFRESSVSPSISFRRCSILTSIALIGSQNLAVKSHPSLFSHALLLKDRKMTCRLDSAVLCTPEPQLFVHWLLAQCYLTPGSMGFATCFFASLLLDQRRLGQYELAYKAGLTAIRRTSQAPVRQSVIRMCFRPPVESDSTIRRPSILFTRALDKGLSWEWSEPKRSEIIYKEKQKRLKVRVCALVARIQYACALCQVALRRLGVRQKRRRNPGVLTFTTDTLMPSSNCLGKKWIRTYSIPELCVAARKKFVSSMTCRLDFTVLYALVQISTVCWLIVVVVKGGGWAHSLLHVCYWLIYLQEVSNNTSTNYKSNMNVQSAGRSAPGGRRRSDLWPAACGNEAGRVAVWPSSSPDRPVMTHVPASLLPPSLTFTHPRTPRAAHKHIAFRPPSSDDMRAELHLMNTFLGSMYTETQNIDKNRNRITNARLRRHSSKLDPRSDIRSSQKTVVPFEFRAGLEIEIKLISNSRNWWFEISIRDQQPLYTNIDESEILNHEISLVQHFYIGTKIKLDPGSELGSFDLGSGKMLVQPGINLPFCFRQRPHGRASGFEKGLGGTGDPRGNPPDQRHRPAPFPRATIPGTIPQGIEPGSHRWEASSLTTIPPRPHHVPGTVAVAESSVHVYHENGRSWAVETRGPFLTNRIRLERASQKHPSDTHKAPYDRVKRCRERKINIKASERVNNLRAHCSTPTTGVSMRVAQGGGGDQQKEPIVWPLTILRTSCKSARCWANVAGGEGQRVSSAVTRSQVVRGGVIEDTAVVQCRDTEIGWAQPARSVHLIFSIWFKPLESPPSRAALKSTDVCRNPATPRVGVSGRGVECAYSLCEHLEGTGRDRKRPGLLEGCRTSLMAGDARVSSTQEATSSSTTAAMFCNKKKTPPCNEGNTLNALRVGAMAHQARVLSSPVLSPRFYLEHIKPFLHITNYKKTPVFPNTFQGKKDWRTQTERLVTPPKERGRLRRKLQRVNYTFFRNYTYSHLAYTTHRKVFLGQYFTLKGGRGGMTARALAFRQGEPGFDSRWGRCRILTCRNRAGRGRWSAGFLWDLPFPWPPRSGAATFPPRVASPSSALKEPQCAPSILIYENTSYPRREYTHTTVSKCVYELHIAKGRFHYRVLCERGDVTCSWALRDDVHFLEILSFTLQAVHHSETRVEGQTTDFTENVSVHRTPSLRTPGLRTRAHTWTDGTFRMTCASTQPLLNSATWCKQRDTACPRVTGSSAVEQARWRRDKTLGLALRRTSVRFPRIDGNKARLARRGHEALGRHASVARNAPSLLFLKHSTCLLNNVLTSNPIHAIFARRVGRKAVECWDTETAYGQPARSIYLMIVYGCRRREKTAVERFARKGDEASDDDAVGEILARRGASVLFYMKDPWLCWWGRGSPLPPLSQSCDRSTALKREGGVEREEVHGAWKPPRVLLTLKQHHLPSGRKRGGGGREPCEPATLNGPTSRRVLSLSFIQCQTRGVFVSGPRRCRVVSAVLPRTTAGVLVLAHEPRHISTRSSSPIKSAWIPYLLSPVAFLNASPSFELFPVGRGFAVSMLVLTLPRLNNRYENFASSMTCRLDSTVLCTLELQLIVHWLLPQLEKNGRTLGSLPVTGSRIPAALPCARESVMVGPRPLRSGVVLMCDVLGKRYILCNVIEELVYRLAYD
ncbi:hypothetical protein PR048_023914 [Dryococelus australis]|uniref:Uncharacterized protein n=1 Tax=Dryococelus australis TaxID=614101 RepID=A0ABQ9GVJ3_9NEOP|nr:hypothetical protein PR048_023914 [Dryococelus australis]